MAEGTRARGGKHIKADEIRVRVQTGTRVVGEEAAFANAIILKSPRQWAPSIDAGDGEVQVVGSGAVHIVQNADDEPTRRFVKHDKRVGLIGADKRRAEKAGQFLVRL